MIKTRSLQGVLAGAGAFLLAFPALAQAPAAAPGAAAPAAAAAAVAAKVDSGDTAWMLASTALVLLMTIPGLALFYAGMVRKKNILATLMQSFTICCLVTIVWMVAGYSLAFTDGTQWIGGLGRAMLSGMTTTKIGRAHV